MMDHGSVLLVALLLAAGEAGSPPALAVACISAARDESVAADFRLADRLRGAGPGAAGQVLYCLSIAWNPAESDAAVREAALRRLQGTDARLVAESVITKIGTATPAERIGMLELMADLFPGMGGVHSSLNAVLAEQIRFRDVEVVTRAISVCSRLRLPDAYLPMREIASRTDSPLRIEAIQGIARLGDPRAVEFFKKLLESNSVPRDEIYRALAQLGRPASILLKSRLDDTDPAERRRAIDALIPMATAEDLTVLYAYIQKYPPEGDLKRALFDTIATIEARYYERPLVGDD